MKSTDSPFRSWRLTAALAMGALLMQGPSASAVAAPPETQPTDPAAPQLSIAIDDGRTDVAPGDRLTYTISVHNLGTTSLDGLVVTQTVPAGSTFDTADAAGTFDASLATWSLDLAAGATATLRTTTVVSQTPDELLRLASVACASVSPAAAPIVCASHSDQLPAGAAATSSSPSSERRPLVYIVGGIVLLVAGAVSTVMLLRRRRSQRLAIV